MTDFLQSDPTCRSGAFLAGEVPSVPMIEIRE
jgi:hypothetical protein